MRTATSATFVTRTIAAATLAAAAAVSVSAPALAAPHAKSPAKATAAKPAAPAKPKPNAALERARQQAARSLATQTAQLDRLAAQVGRDTRLGDLQDDALAQVAAARTTVATQAALVAGATTTAQIQAATKAADKAAQAARKDVSDLTYAAGVAKTVAQAQARLDEMYAVADAKTAEGYDVTAATEKLDQAAQDLVLADAAVQTYTSAVVAVANDSNVVVNATRARSSLARVRALIDSATETMDLAQADLDAAQLPDPGTTDPGTTDPVV